MIDFNLTAPIVAPIVFIVFTAFIVAPIISTCPGFLGKEKPN